ncbi:MAG: XRE family transcriptional regulator [Rhizomicrobium sp.]|jgi:transcriptional regulator with XRE-family HTH domain
MSIIVDEPSGQIAARIAAEREHRGWSLAELAERSGVSKAMLSKIQREEVSPTATLLSRIATAFGLTLAGLLEPTSPPPASLLRKRDQPRWQDPATGYVRRQVFQSALNPLELVEVNLPAGSRVALPASSYAFIRQVVWLLSGRLDIREGAKLSSLEPGDRLEFGPPADSEFHNPGDKTCRYLVALVRQ